MDNPQVERCELCRYWKNDGKTHEPVGSCRRHAPVVVMERYTYQLVERTDTRAAFPLMPRNGYCGDFQQTDGKVVNKHQSQKTEGIVDDAYCPVCDSLTKHKFTSTGHERDSSQDMQECLACGAYKFGDGGWHRKNGVSIP